ncbi:FtsK/SpoIIIE domain-containing protein [Streptococcus gordonii]|uniref:FtsK/SpoIIIE domain-containing protein n=1 Tax=Streptococcus gordonii TaxID=1302 RepID=UPI0005F342D0|nr:FtsK/SpoIIIE domain-containing protein [Streptococcus gordonii]KJU96479.1 FtsK/SpoIIIE family protein [Streptococcus gordonii]
MKLFTYRGVRVKKYHEKIRRITFFIFLLPFLLGFGFFIYTHQVQLQQSPLPYGIGLGVSFLIIILLLLLLQAICYQKLLFFGRLGSLRIISHFLIENNLVLVKKIKTEKGFIERTSLPIVYLKRDRFSVTVTFQLQGSRFQERFIALEKTLEIMFDGDFMNKQFTKGYVSYTIAIGPFSGRLSVFDVKTTDKGICLMKGVYWDFDKQPHLLIGGGTGGGKTILIMVLVWILAQIGYVEILDPKRSDFVGLKNIPVFKGRVFWEKEDMLNCLKEAEQEMDRRFDYMTSQSDYQAGKKYFAYGLKPRFIIIDELAALAAKLERDYASASVFIEYLTELILKGRQSGVYMISAMQRPDGEYLKTSLRDQFMKRISVGHLEDVGYKMMFGDANANKLFKKIDEIDGEEISGRGYIANGGEIAREFYSPLVPLDDGFSFFDEFKKLPPLEDPLAINQPTNDLSDTVETEEIEDALLSLNTFAENTKTPVSTLRNLVKYIEEQDYTFTRAENRIMLDRADISLLEELLMEKEQSGLSYKQVVLEHFTAIEPA